MAFQRMETNVENVSALPDIVAAQSAQLKQTFDKAGKDLKAFVNTHITELESGTAAESLGAKTPGGLPSTVQAELNAVNVLVAGKADAVEGKQLSTEDYTTEEKTKLAGIEENANNYVLPVASTTETGGIKVDGTTIVVENGIAKAIAADSADYTARAEIEALKQEKAETITYTATIPSTGWTASAPYYVDVAIEGLLETDNPMITPVYTGTVETDAAIKEAWNKIDRATTGSNSLRVYAFEEVPSANIPVQLQVVR